MQFDRAHDAQVRAAAFQWLRGHAPEGGVVPRTLLAEGFQYRSRRVPLLGPQGIFKPAAMEVPLSITTAPNGPYDDAFGPDLLRYRYRGTDPDHPDNRGLRTAMRERVPLVYLHGLIPGRYVPTWPVYIVGADDANLTFSVAVDDEAHLHLTRHGFEHSGSSDVRRAYVTTMTRKRLHQEAFRERVLRAYRNQCALCCLRHAELLEAAHIIPDAHPEGEPVVSNGLSLCRLHHGAFDRFFLGVRPDYVIEIRPDLLEEVDGPTLRHAIQALHGQEIILPTRHVDRPSVRSLEERYEQFRTAAR